MVSQLTDFCDKWSDKCSLHSSWKDIFMVSAVGTVIVDRSFRADIFLLLQSLVNIRVIKVVGIIWVITGSD